MGDQTKTFGQATAQALTNAAASQGLSTKGSTTSTSSSQRSRIEHKRRFLETFRRWEILFKRRDGDPAAEKWLIAEYYDSLGHLSDAGLDTLTKMLKASCTFFPSIKECLDLTQPKGRYDWGHPFLNAPQMLLPAHLAAPVAQIGTDAETRLLEGNHDG